MNLIDYPPGLISTSKKKKKSRKAGQDEYIERNVLDCSHDIHFG